MSSKNKLVSTVFSPHPPIPFLRKCLSIIDASEMLWLASGFVQQWWWW